MQAQLFSVSFRIATNVGLDNGTDIIDRGSVLFPMDVTVVGVSVYVNQLDVPVDENGVYPAETLNAARMTIGTVVEEEDIFEGMVPAQFSSGYDLALVMGWRDFAHGEPYQLPVGTELYWQYVGSDYKVGDVALNYNGFVIFFLTS